MKVWHPGGRSPLLPGLFQPSIWCGPHRGWRTRIPPNQFNNRSSPLAKDDGQRVLAGNQVTSYWVCLPHCPSCGVSWLVVSSSNTTLKTVLHSTLSTLSPQPSSASFFNIRQAIQTFRGHMRCSLWQDCVPPCNTHMELPGQKHPPQTSTSLPLYRCFSSL